MDLKANLCTKLAEAHDAVMTFCAEADDLFYPASDLGVLRCQLDDHLDQLLALRDHLDQVAEDRVNAARAQIRVVARQDCQSGGDRGAAILAPQAKRP